MTSKRQRISFPAGLISSPKKTLFKNFISINKQVRSQLKVQVTQMLLYDNSNHGLAINPFPLHHQPTFEQQHLKNNQRTFFKEYSLRFLISLLVL